jgi:ribosomal protein S25
VYLLKSVGTHSASNKILFCLFFKEPKLGGKASSKQAAAAKKESKDGKQDGKEVKKNHTRIDLVEKEVVKKSVPLDHVVQVLHYIALVDHIIMIDFPLSLIQVRQLPENPCTVELIYLLDVPEKKKKKKATAGDDKPQAFQITFTFISLRDANDVTHLIHSIVAKTFSV